MKDHTILIDQGSLVVIGENSDSYLWSTPQLCSYYYYYQLCSY